MENLMKHAQKYVSLMDQDDLNPAKEFLAPNCEYKSGEKIFSGPDEVMASYQEHADYAKATFDKVIYESQVKQLEPYVFEATYIDILTKNGLSHTYKCKQIFEFNKDSKIVRIDHVSIAGEYEALKNFYKDVGLNGS